MNMLTGPSLVIEHEIQLITTKFYKLFRYDCEEHTTMFDGDNSMYLGDDSSYKKKEAEMPKKLVSSLFVYLCINQAQKFVIAFTVLIF